MDSHDPNKSTDPLPSSVEQAAALRVIDANLNRCSEAIRVVEDSLRFVFADSHLQGICKSIRHELGNLAIRLGDPVRLVAVRDAAGDVGRSSGHPDEYQRADINQILKANFARAAQSLRSLEEFCKLVDTGAAVTAEEIRYRIYELEKAALLLDSSQRRLNDIRLCVIVDGHSQADDFQTTIQAIIDGGADMIQLRDKNLDDRVLLDRACCLVDACRRAGVIAIVNDRTDIAIASGADGVHLGQDDLSVARARLIGGPEMIIGISTHNLAQARQAVLDGADYIGVGPVFPSGTKHFTELAGTDLLESVASEISLPSLAIGGINFQNIDQVLTTGVSRVAVAGGVLRAETPVRQATSALANRLTDGRPIDGARQHA